MSNLIFSLLIGVVGIGAPILIIYIAWLKEDYDAQKLGRRKHKWLVDVKSPIFPGGMSPMKIAIYPKAIVFSNLLENLGKGKQLFRWHHGQTRTSNLERKYKYYLVNSANLIELAKEGGQIRIKFEGEFGDTFEFLLSLDSISGVKFLSPDSMEVLFDEIRDSLGK